MFGILIHKCRCLKFLTSNKELPNKILNSGIYELICQTCNYAYVGQTSRDLHTRYKEHTRYINNNDPKSAYAQHILDNQHEFGPAHKTIELIQACNKRNETLHWENLYIRKYSTEGKLISEQTPHEYNILISLGRLATTHTSRQEGTPPQGHRQTVPGDTKRHVT
jgi:hypothetical protein